MEAFLNNVPSDHTAFPIADASDVGFARRGAADAARRAGFDETQAGRLALIVTEAATNILKHAGHGEMLIRDICENSVPAAHDGAAPIAPVRSGVELIAIDKGPGIHDLGAALIDGTSSAGTPGNGLGAMRRLADDFTIYSQPGIGTVLRAYLRASGGAPAPAPGAGAIDIGGVGVPFPGEAVCGDAWNVLSDAKGLTVVVIDGLGHGPDAHRASVAGLQVAYANRGRTPTELIERMHDVMRPTRGAAVAVAQIDLAAARVVFAGIGNISACVLGADALDASALGGGSRARQLISHNGIVGHTVRKIQEFDAPWERGAMLVMHSDGIGTRWQLEQYPGLAHRAASLIAATLYRDFSRRRDDATVVVVKAASG